MSTHAEALLALVDYMSAREKAAEIEALDDKYCECDVDNFHSCGFCKDLSELQDEMKRLLGLWGDHWAVMLAEKGGTQ